MDLLPEELVEVIIHHNALILVSCSCWLYKIMQKIKYEVLAKYAILTSKVDNTMIKIQYWYNNTNIYQIINWSVVILNTQNSKYSDWVITKYDPFRKLIFKLHIDNYHCAFTDTIDLFLYKFNKIDKSIIERIEIHYDKLLIIDVFYNDSLEPIAKTLLNEDEYGILTCYSENIINYILNRTDWDVSHFMSEDLLKIFNKANIDDSDYLFHSVI